MNKERILVQVGTKKIGDTFTDWAGIKYRVSGLGKEFMKFIPDDETSAYGLMPGEDYHLKMQYAYIEKEN